MPTIGVLCHSGRLVHVISGVMKAGLMARGFKKPTQKTIAEIVGVAVTTVSRALQGDPKIAEATRKKVADVAGEIGYVPDRAAQRLRTGKTKTISLLLNPHDEILGFGNSLIAGLSQALQGSGYHLIITPVFGLETDLKVITRIVRNGMADAIVLSRTENFDDRVRFLMEKGFPFICHGRTDFTQQHSFVDFNNEAFAYEAVKRLAEKGRHNLAIILPREIYSFHQHLRYGFMRGVRELGLNPVIPDNISLDSAPSEIRDWVTQVTAVIPSSEKGFQQPVDGFVCPGESCYLAVAAGLKKVGWIDHRDFDVVVKSNSTILEQIDENLDRIGEDIYQAGFTMGKNLVKLLSEPESGPYQTLQEPSIYFYEKNRMSEGADCRD